jgi:hypothetical protein
VAASTTATTTSKTIIRIGDLAGAGGMSDIWRLERLPNPSQQLRRGDRGECDEERCD